MPDISLPVRLSRALFYRYQRWISVSLMVALPRIAMAAENPGEPAISLEIMLLIGCLIGIGGTVFVVYLLRRSNSDATERAAFHSRWKPGAITIRNVSLSRAKARSMRQTVSLLLDYIGPNVMVFINEEELLDTGSTFASYWSLPDYLLKTRDAEKVLDAMSRKVVESDDFLVLLRRQLQANAQEDTRTSWTMVDGRRFEIHVLNPESQESTLRVVVFRDISQIISSSEGNVAAFASEPPLSIAQIDHYARISICETAKRLDRPFVAFRGATYLLDHCEDDALKSIYMQHCLEECRKIADELEPLQALTPYGTCSPDAQSQPIMLSSLVGELVEMVLPSTEAQGLWMQLDFAPDIPGTVYGQDILLCRLLLLVLHNAIAYTEKGQIEMGVRLSPSKPKMQGDVATRVNILFVVSDPGKGMVEKRDAACAELGGPSRPGLWINAALCLAHALAGEFWLESDTSGGTSCYADLPFLLQPESVQEEDIQNVESHRRILLADDDTMNRRFASRFLEEAGFEVIEAVDGNDALEKLGQTTFQAVLLDISMPGLDGREVVRTIRAGGVQGVAPNLPVMALTASEKEECQDILAAGFDVILSKPFDVETFKAALEKHELHETELGHTLTKKIDETLGEDPIDFSIARMVVSHFVQWEKRAENAVLSGDRGELVEAVQHINELAALLGMERVREIASKIISSHSIGRNGTHEVTAQLHQAIHSSLTAYGFADASPAFHSRHE